MANHFWSPLGQFDLIIHVTQEIVPTIMLKFFVLIIKVLLTYAWPLVLMGVAALITHNYFIFLKDVNGKNAKTVETREAHFLQFHLVCLIRDSQ